MLAAISFGSAIELVGFTAGLFIALAFLARWDYRRICRADEARKAGARLAAEADGLDQPNPIRVIGGSKGPTIEHPSGHERVGI